MITSSGVLDLTWNGDAVCSIATTSLTASSNAPSCVKRQLNKIICGHSRTYLSDILDDDKLELVAEGAELFLDVRSFALAADSGSDGEACFEERLQCPCADEPVGSSDEHLSGGDCWHGERDEDPAVDELEFGWSCWFLLLCSTVLYTLV